LLESELTTHLSASYLLPAFNRHLESNTIFMKHKFVVFITLFLYANVSVALFNTPKIASKSGGFYYHKILPSMAFHLKSSLNSNSTQAVVILGGGPGFSSWNLETVQKNIAHLGHQAYLMDMLGIGENKFTRPGKPLVEWVKQIRQLKTEVSPNKKIIVVAHSWGALMAMIYTRHYADDIAKIILLNPVDPQKKAMQNLTDEIHNRNNQELEIKWNDDSAWENNTSTNENNIKHITLRQIQQVLPTYFLDYQQGKKYASQFTEQDFNINLNIQAWQEYDAKPITFSEIESWQKPITFLDCKQDYLMPYNLNAMQPNMQFESVTILNKCGHFPWIEQPRLFSRFLKKSLHE